MGAEFTFANVRIVVQAVANYLKRRFPGRAVSVVVNYDTRFLSERYANEAAKILSHNQIKVLLSDRDAPAQAQALQVIMRKAQAGINFTASFNPPEYNGLKLNLETGAPALPGETDKIEEEVQRIEQDQQTDAKLQAQVAMAGRPAPNQQKSNSMSSKASAS